MTRSMTAYGRAHIHQYLIEIHSVNRRGLEMNLQLPRELLALDIEMRRWIKDVIVRGMVTVRISKDKNTALGDLPTAEELRPLQDHFNTLSHTLDLPPVDLPFLCTQLSSDGIASISPDELKKGVCAALEDLLKMKFEEGATLVKDIEKRLQTLKNGIDAIESNAKATPELLQKRLEDKLKLLKVPPEDVAKEVVLFADRCDVTEELVRLRSHLDQFVSQLSNDEKSIGRTLDFLLIEMARELNTIASKAFQQEIASQAPLLKAEVEKMREQVQNIE